MGKSLQELFSEVARKQKKKGEAFNNYYSSDFVDNEIVAYLKIEKGTPRYAEWIKEGILIKDRKTILDYEYNSDLPLKTIALILESPHINEFEKNREDEVLRGNHPACGKTGKMIKQHFLRLVNQYYPTIEQNGQAKYVSTNDVLSGIYRLVLVNMIKYQTSLGENTKKHRSKVMSQLIGNNRDGNEFIEDFKKEITKYNPDVVINATTSGFKKRVWKFLKNTLKENVVKIEAQHPSCWNEYSSFQPKK